MSHEECIFCKIAKGVIDSATIFENSEFRIILDRAPATRGHALIIPKEHFTNIFELDSDTAGKLFALATHVARGMKKVLGCEGLNVIQNNGEVAGQTVMHFHLHLIPRYKGDQVKLKWTPQSVSDEELKEVSKLIKKQI